MGAVATKLRYVAKEDTRLNFPEGTLFNWVKRSVLFTDKQNHGQDVMTIGAAIDRHGTPLHETPC